MDQLNFCTNPNHKSASRMFGYALTLGDPDAWLGAVRVFRVRLTESELASAGFAILKAQDPEYAALTVEAVLGHPSTPRPPLLSEMDEAASWADWADYRYIKACILAGFNRMTIHDQAAFLDYVHGRAAA